MSRQLSNTNALPFPASRWETARTVLRPYTPADEKAFLNLWGDPVVQRLSFIEDLSPKKTEEFLRRTLESVARGSLFFVVVEDKERREFLGHVSLNLQPPPERDAAVGIALKGRYRGRGFGTELMHWLITYGFRELGLRRISLTVMENNIPALRMYKKMQVLYVPELTGRHTDLEADSGFIDEGRTRDGTGSNGRSRVFICMGIEREEWDIQRGRKREFRVN
ncbi:acyl-CoA N-acyltransferase [Lactifluus subvellereus]|nr:acyl-CoA N-acyltransferase [Lactifluus subvellereus]